MARIRLNQEYRNKVANRMRVHIEQEDTQEKEYSAFYDEGDHLKELTLAGKYNQTIALYEGKREEFFEKKGFFSQITRKEKYKEQLKIISTNFNEKYSKKIRYLL